MKKSTYFFLLAIVLLLSDNLLAQDINKKIGISAIDACTPQLMMNPTSIVKKTIEAAVADTTTVIHGISADETLLVKVSRTNSSDFSKESLPITPSNTNVSEIVGNQYRNIFGPYKPSLNFSSTEQQKTGGSQFEADASTIINLSDTNVSGIAGNKYRNIFGPYKPSSTLSSTNQEEIEDSKCQTDTFISITSTDNPRREVDTKWLLPEYWNLQKIKAPEVWAMLKNNLCINDKPINICLMDTGINTNNESLKKHLCSLYKNKQIYGYNDYTDDDDINDDDGHGTFCAELISAVVGHEEELSENVKFMVYKIDSNYDSLISMSESQFKKSFSRGITWACKHHAKILNCSFGSYWKKIKLNEQLTKALNRAHKEGLIIVTSAGNDNINLSNNEYFHYPSGFGIEGYDNIVVIAASTKGDSLWKDPNNANLGSNYGQQSVHLGAPGESITSTLYHPPDYEPSGSGTSSAAPHVSGALALIHQLFPEQTPCKIIQQLCVAADPINYDDNRSIAYGRLNIADALKGENKIPLNSTLHPTFVDPNSYSEEADDSDFFESHDELEWDEGVATVEQLN